MTAMSIRTSQNLLAWGVVVSLFTGVLAVVQAEPALKAYVNYGDMVPQDLFGAWKRVRHIEKASAGDIEGTTEEGRWIIYRDGKRIVLQNPETGVETEVQVEKVFNGTAVFHYNKQLSAGRWCHEQLTLTPEEKGMVLSGFQVKECFEPSPDKKGQVSYYQAFARVTGVRDQSLPPIR
jgi:hypothetical protein